MTSCLCPSPTPHPPGEEGCGTWWLCSARAQAPGGTCDWPIPNGLAFFQGLAGRPGPPPASTSARPSPHAEWPAAALRGSLGLCLDWLSVWLLVCQSLSMGQGAFKANLLARQDAQSRILHLLCPGTWGQRWLISSILLPPPRCQKGEQGWGKV